ncbi:RHS repeat-associated core domain-containing protein [Flavobacterium lipolyticum]|uniref:RHS repeat-associated core domain-containing protein n=1 Tax=Flavobacterium lipolyticum TaxID=2893754 RepID=UPI0032048110
MKIKCILDLIKDPPVEANRFGAFAVQSTSQAAPSRPTLEFFPTAEGYYDYVGKKYVYQYKDHLGNIRLSYAKNPATQVLTIIDENNYYPFGLKHNGYNDYVPTNNKYKYNGKELQDENIGGNQLNLYDYGARNYDPALGRWMNIDPLAEKYDNFTPYAYTVNNPIFFTDPDGMRIRWASWSDVKNDENLSKQFSSRKEYREARRELKKQYNDVLKNSETATKIYGDLDADSATHTIFATKETGGNTTVAEGGGTNIKIGVGDGSSNFLDGITSNDANIQAQVGHEGGHAWLKMNGLEEGKTLPSRDNANSFDVKLYNNYYENRERTASHIENIIRGELINSGAQNMNLSSKYFGTTLNYTGGSFSKYETKTNTFQLLNNNPYNAQGYLSQAYKLPAPKKK